MLHFKKRLKIGHNILIFKYIELLNTFLNDYNLSFLIASKLHIYALSSVLVILVLVVTH